MPLELSSNVVRRGPCERCGSRDNKVYYDDGHAKCFGHGCGAFWRADGKQQSQQGHMGNKESKLIKWTPCDLPERRIREDVCRRYKYGTSVYKGRPCQVANYCDDTGRSIAQKLRFEDKTFALLGNGRDLPFCGQWLFNSGKTVVITEGEIDMLTVGQTVAANKYPVVSLPNGVSSAANTIKAQLEWLDKFETIILCFDMDKPGRAAIAEVAPLLPVGRVKIMNLPEKDANAVLVKRNAEQLTKAYWDAKEWRPDGIISGAELTVEVLKSATTKGLPWPTWLPRLQEMTLGIRPGELTLLTAGTGVGKSTLARELGYYLHQEHGQKIGNVFLEESNAKTAQAYVAIHHSVPLGRLRADPGLLSDNQWEEAQRRVISDRMWFYNHFGSLDSKNLLRKLRYLRQGLRADFVLLDHISIVISGTESSSEGERRDIDMFMTALRSLVEETGVGIIAIVHLSQPKGMAHEEGAQVSLNQLRGSGALKQLSDNVIALERDQQGDGREGKLARDPTLMTLRLLKCRELGETGPADEIKYDRETGRLVRVSPFEPLPF